MKKLRVLDLFSGIGGFSLGLERTGGFETVAFCEIDQFCRSVITKHWPGIPIYDDVRSLTGKQLAADGIAIDVITAGWPCQDASKANCVWGDRLGIHGSRTGLFSEVTRLAGELGQPVLLLENTTDVLEWFDDILSGLAALGYDAEWHCIPAASIGAPHYRDRIWIVAYTSGKRLQGLSKSQESNREAEGASAWGAAAGGAYQALSDRAWCEDEPPFCRVDDGVPSNVDIAALGNSVVPQIVELIGRSLLETWESAA